MYLVVDNEAKRAESKTMKVIKVSDEAKELLEMEVARQRMEGRKTSMQDLASNIIVTGIANGQLIIPEAKASKRR